MFVNDLKRMDSNFLTHQVDIRTKMLEFKANYKNNKEFKSDKWLCKSCEKEVEAQ